PLAAGSGTGSGAAGAGPRLAHLTRVEISDATIGFPLRTARTRASIPMTQASPSQGTQQPRLEFVMCASPAGTHRMAYWEWGDPDNDRVLLCVHGLTRTGRDFDQLARRLSSRYRVVCPDVVGRGKSDWLINAAGYVVP